MRPDEETDVNNETDPSSKDSAAVPGTQHPSKRKSEENYEKKQNDSKKKEVFDSQKTDLQALDEPTDKIDNHGSGRNSFFEIIKRHFSAIDDYRKPVAAAADDEQDREVKQFNEAFKNIFSEMMQLVPQPDIKQKNKCTNPECRCQEPEEYDESSQFIPTHSRRSPNLISGKCQHTLRPEEPLVLDVDSKEVKTYPEPVPLTAPLSNEQNPVSESVEDAINKVVLEEYCRIVNAFFRRKKGTAAIDDNVGSENFKRDKGKQPMSKRYQYKKKSVSVSESSVQSNESFDSSGKPIKNYYKDSDAQTTDELETDYVEDETLEGKQPISKILFYEKESEPASESSGHSFRSFSSSYNFPKDIAKEESLERQIKDDSEIDDHVENKKIKDCKGKQPISQRYQYRKKSTSVSESNVQSNQSFDSSGKLTKSYYKNSGAQTTDELETDYVEDEKFKECKQQISKILFYEMESKSASESSGKSFRSFNSSYNSPKDTAKEENLERQITNNSEIDDHVENEKLKEGKGKQPISKRYAYKKKSSSVSESSVKESSSGQPVQSSDSSNILSETVSSGKSLKTETTNSLKKGD